MTCYQMALMIRRTEQKITEQNRTEQKITEQNRTADDRTEQNRTEDDRTEQIATADADSRRQKDLPPHKPMLKKG